jgi:phage terminase large subunit-like protein
MANRIPDPVDALAVTLAAARARGLSIPADLRARELEQEAARRGILTYATFTEFVQARNPSLLQFEHVRLALPTLEQVAAGELRRVMVLWPTQYHKSELWSRLLPAYYLMKHPNRTVALASYGADLAWELSGDARDYYAVSGGQFREGSLKGATRNWRTLRKAGLSGGMWATGIGGPALGRGFNLGIVDDPIDPEQVTRAAYQRRFARWWPSKWLRGQRPGASAIVFVMQRLAIDDPVAWLLEREEGRTAEHWHILAFDEVRSDEPFARWKGPRGFPETCTVAKDPRPVGQILSPAWRDKPEVERIQAQVGSVVAAAQRQQRPMRPTGDFWALKWFEGRVYDTLPPDAHNGGWDWDTAYSGDQENSATAGVKTFRGAGPKDDFRVYVEDVQWDWLEFPELVALLKALKGPHYVEKKASGKSVVQQLKAYNVPAEEVLVPGDKLARASAAQPAAATGRVYVNRRVFDKLLYGEHQGILRITAEALVGDTAGLDLNDALVQALHRHLEIGSKKVALVFG